MMHSTPTPTSIYPPCLPKIPASAPLNLRTAVKEHNTKLKGTTQANINRWNCTRVRGDYNARKEREKEKPKPKAKAKAKPKAKAKAKPKAKPKGKSKHVGDLIERPGKRPKKLGGFIAA